MMPFFVVVFSSSGCARRASPFETQYAGSIPFAAGLPDSLCRGEEVDRYRPTSPWQAGSAAPVRLLGARGRIRYVGPVVGASTARRAAHAALPLCRASLHRHRPAGLPLSSSQTPVAVKEPPREDMYGTVCLALLAAALLGFYIFFKKKREKRERVLSSKEWLQSG